METPSSMTRQVRPLRQVGINSAPVLSSSSSVGATSCDRPGGVGGSYIRLSLLGFLAVFVAAVLSVRGQIAHGSEEISEAQTPACNAPPRAEPLAPAESLPNPVTESSASGESGTGSTGPGTITAIRPPEGLEPPNAEELARREAILKGSNLSPSWPPEKTQAEPSPPSGPWTAPKETR